MIIPGLVTTIIPVYNRASMLRAAVESVLSQTYRPIEIVIADDGSTDDTPLTARSLVEQHPQMVRYFAHSNQGPGPARELGRLHASGEYIQYLDSDDRLLPNKFADQVSVLNTHPDCDIAYGVTRLVDETGKILADPFKWTNLRITSVFPGLLVDRWWCTHTPLYRRSLTDKIGPWSNLRWSQDWEYDARAGALKARLVHCESLVSEHVHHFGERQTSTADWGSDPVRLRNRSDLLKALWKNAEATGIEKDCPERQHFARWCFRVARQSGAAGLGNQCRELLELAACASAGGAGNRGLRFYSAVDRLLGSRLTGKIAGILELSRKRASSNTLQQSFSGQMPHAN